MPTANSLRAYRLKLFWEVGSYLPEPRERNANIPSVIHMLEPSASGERGSN